jgi:cyclopropane fatty-acyl-phospholipid synthase-like methyltransferase
MSDHHDHPRDHSSEHNHDYTKANAEHFDKESKNQVMIEHGTRLAQSSVPFILKHYKFDKRTTEVLDFASGWGASILAVENYECVFFWRTTGLVSERIIPYAKSILGVDISQGMVDLYNEAGREEGSEVMKAVRADLKGEDGELDGQKFDVIIVSAPCLRGCGNWTRIATV